MDNLVPTRSALLVTISRFPGIRFRELRTKTGLANGTLAYHLQLLERRGLLKVERRPRFAGFYPSHFPLEDSKVFGLIRQSRSRQILSLLLKTHQATHGNIASSLNIAPSTASWYLGRLIKSGLLTAVPTGRETIYLVSSPDQVLKLLSVYQSTWENLVSRFVSSWEDLSL